MFISLVVGLIVLIGIAALAAVAELSRPERGFGVLAREFEGDLKLLIAASPTRGLDVAAVDAVHAHLCDAAERGVAVLLISEDLDEILTLNDRVLVMYEGNLTEARNRESIEEIGLLMAGG